MYYPLKKDIFAAFNYTPLNNLKVILVGQDPYHQAIIDSQGLSVPRAVGLSFSVRREDSIPSSLKNIYIELANTVRNFTVPDHGDLKQWSRQGILLINSCLTVKPRAAGSHGDIWLGFINKVFKAIAVANPQCIYVLWGKDAQKLKPIINDKGVIFESSHPSGLSATRGFFGCNHFNLINNTLLKQNKVGINWRISPLAELHRLEYPHLYKQPLEQNKEEPKPQYNNEEIKSVLPNIPMINFTIVPQVNVEKKMTEKPLFLDMSITKVT